MRRVPRDHHMSPVGTHAGDRTSKKTVPGAFEVPRQLYGNLSLTCLGPKSETALPKVAAAPPRNLTNLKREAEEDWGRWLGKCRKKRLGSSQNDMASGGPTKATCLRPKPFRPTAAHAMYRYLGHTRPARSRRRCCGGI